MRRSQTLILSPRPNRAVVRKRPGKSCPNLALNKWPVSPVLPFVRAKTSSLSLTSLTSTRTLPAILTLSSVRISMISLLTHTVAHSTRPSYVPKVNNQPLTKVFKSCRQLSKICQNWQNSDFQSQFSMSKVILIFLIFFMILGHTFCCWHFLKTSLFKPLYFLKWHPIFDNFYSTECWTQKLGLVISFGPKGMPGRMCDIVR